jgi:hypothetical protein
VSFVCPLSWVGEVWVVAAVLLCAGSFWLNPPLPVDENGNWYNPPPRPAEFMDVDPL